MDDEDGEDDEDDDGCDGSDGCDEGMIVARKGVTPNSLTESRFHRCGDAKAANGVRVLYDDDDDDDDDDEATALCGSGETAPPSTRRRMLSAIFWAAVGAAMANEAGAPACRAGVANVALFDVRVGYICCVCVCCCGG